MIHHYLFDLVRVLPAAASRLHGIRHWECVFNFGTEIARNTPAVDLAVVQAFALLHDCQRRSDGRERDHGYRASLYAHEIRPLIQLPDDPFDQLLYALEHHTNQLHHPDPTIGACWDADRLDLTRIRIKPDPRKLNTDYGKMKAAEIRRNGAYSG